MNNPTYTIHVSYVPLRTDGLVNVSILGTTQSVSTQSGNYFLATMDYTEISATGPDYRSALNNLLIIATASSTPSPGVMPFKQTW